jgi:LysM repeat protein
MPDRQPNQVARAAALIALVAAFTVVAALVVTNGGSSGGGSGDRAAKSATQTSQPTQRGERALEKGSYKVQEGDTLAQISAETGVDVNTLEQLNPNLDPQVLSPGQRVRLR